MPPINFELPQWRIFQGLLIVSLSFLFLVQFDNKTFTLFLGFCIIYILEKYDLYQQLFMISLSSQRYSSSWMISRFLNRIMSVVLSLSANFKERQFSGLYTIWRGFCKESIFFKFYKAIFIVATVFVILME